MLIDHLAWCLCTTTDPLGFSLHFIGRLTGPIMAFMLAEGYLHTRNVKKYGIRLLIFALISWIPFSLFETGTWPQPALGVIFTLFLGLIAIWVWDRTNLHVVWKIVIVALLCALSIFGDWPIFAILWPLFFVFCRANPTKKRIAFAVISLSEVLFAQLAAIFIMENYLGQLFQVGVILVVPFFLLYNGESGSRHPFHKWFFYVFYPLHLLILALLFRL